MSFCCGESVSSKLDSQNTFVCGVQRATGGISPAIIYSLGPNARNGLGKKPPCLAILQKHPTPLPASRGV